MAEEHEHKKEEVKTEHHVNKIELHHKPKKNNWVLSSVILTIIVIVLLILVILPYTNYSGNKVGKKFVSYINENSGSSIEFVKSKSLGKDIYEITVSYNGQEIPVYVTKDGKIYSLTLADVLAKTTDTNTNTNTEIPKSDVPVVELFVMSYCPYGTQAEKGIMPVYELLGNKINGSVKFVHYILHGEKETIENYRQICIREEQNSKLIPYLKCILNSTSTTAPADVNTCLQKVGVDVAKLNTCMNTNMSAKYYSIDSALSENYGVQGSPTLVINGKIIESGRSPAEYLDVICQAFNTAPEECGTALSTTTPSAGFGYGSSGSGSSASCN
jgi:protein-disulfide isomerase